MCGIVGIVSSISIGKNPMPSMIQKLEHRGPDAKDSFVAEDRKVALGHTRLSILDLSANANQPFHSKNDRYVIVYNGEVFNFKTIKKKLEDECSVVFSTTSDTEVILEAFNCYGPNMIDFCEGMFAFAIFDKLEGRVHLFRDRIGKKPLFYYLSSSLFVFGSELKSILSHPDVRSCVTLDMEAVHRFLHLGYIPEPLTIYNEIKKFPAGSYGVIDQQLQLQIKPYWSVETSVHLEITDERKSKKHLHELLHQSVKDRLISDVPVGAFLSGGIDSSLVAALASRHTTDKLKTFTIGFKETDFDESIYSSKVARHIGSEHFEFKLSQQEAIDILETYTQHFDEPFYDTSAIPMMLVSSLARKYVKVALTGDGGDELFQGYGAYQWADRLESSIWRTARKPAKFIFDTIGKTRFQKISHLLEDVPRDQQASHIYSQEQGLFSQAEIMAMLVDRSSFVHFKPMSNGKFQALRPSERQALFDLRCYLKDDLLVKVDRSSMFHALECRCPLLDYRVVEFAFGLPYNLKVRDGKTKWILREILKEYFPAHFFDRPKRGFSIPLAQWMKGELRFLVDDFLNDKVIDDVGIVRRDVVKDLVSRFQRGDNYLYTRLWALIVMHKWMLESNVSLKKF